MSARAASFRQWLGVLLLDYGRYRRAIRQPGTQWMTICNRHEVVRVAPDGAGVECPWRWTSELHAVGVMPQLGRLLLDRAMREAPVVFAEGPVTAPAATPVVSVIIGHRGKERLPLLKATLQSLAAQRDVAFECIVVEHAEHAELHGALPAWVKRGIVKASPGELYNRSSAFNEGARLAAGAVLVFHDNDLLVPARYLARIANRVQEGFEVVNLKRYLFYLNEADTGQVVGWYRVSPGMVPQMVLQNATGGGSLAVSRSAFEAVGGWDEEFQGWGGEDVDFWDRLQTRKVYPYGCFPLIHLWHKPQSDKTPQKDSAAMQRLAEISRSSVEERIRRLKST